MNIIQTTGKPKAIGRAQESLHFQKTRWNDLTSRWRYLCHPRSESAMWGVQGTPWGNSHSLLQDSRLFFRYPEPPIILPSVEEHHLGYGQTPFLRGSPESLTGQCGCTNSLTLALIWDTSEWPSQFWSSRAPTSQPSLPFSVQSASTGPKNTPLWMPCPVITSTSHCLSPREPNLLGLSW